MAHEITDTDKVFTVREPAWHGLSHVFEDYPTSEQARELVHPWEPVTEPVYRKEVFVDAASDELRTEYVEIPGALEVTRSDNHGSLGVVSATYQPVSNTALYEIAEAIESGGSDVRLETGGSLRGGRKVWLLLRLDEPIVVAGDPHGATLPYYALQNAHDGTAALRGQALMTRIVCDNTAQAADFEARERGTEFTFRHTRSIHERIEEAKAALSGWRDSIEVYQRVCEHLMELPVGRKKTERFLELFVPMPAASLQSERVRRNVEDARGDIRLILNGPTCADINHSAYGLVQATVEYAQHYRAARGDGVEARNESRFNRAYLTRSRLTADAIKLAEEVAG